MSDGARVFRRLAERTFLTCVRELVQAVVGVAGIPLFFVSVFSVISLSAGIGVVLAPKSLLAARRLASQQRRWARDMSRVTIVTPYRPRPVEVTNGLIGRLQRCKWLLTDFATWRDLLWVPVNGSAGVVLGLLPAFGVVCGAWTLAVDGGALLYGPWRNAVPGFWPQVFFLSMLPLGVITGPWLLKAHAQVASSLLAPTREEMAAQVGRLTESRSQAVDASAAELRRIERDLHDGAQARLVALGLNIGFAEQVVRDDPDLALSLLAEALANAVKHSGANRAWVQLEHGHGRLVAIVGDNGTGGAALRAGGGLRGVEQRLAAFDGVIAVTSPDGGPTLVIMELPCELSLART